jgi:N-acyl-D-aspartate/D-glutamate deacylase
MGERAFDKAATDDDLRAMERELRQALSAGAMGFTTSRSPSHETPDRRPVASRVANWDEVRRLVSVMGEMNAGIFEIAGERSTDPAGLRDYHVRLRDLAVETGRPITWGLFSRREDPTLWRTYIALLDETARAGGRMFAQVHSRALTVVLSFKTNLPFDRLPVWKELRALPLEEQKRRLRDPELRGRLVAAAREREERRPIGAEARRLLRLDLRHGQPDGPYRSVADVARSAPAIPSRP